MPLSFLSLPWLFLRVPSSSFWRRGKQQCALASEPSLLLALALKPSLLLALALKRTRTNKLFAFNSLEFFFSLSRSFKVGTRTEILSLQKACASSLSLSLFLASRGGVLSSNVTSFRGCGSKVVHRGRRRRRRNVFEISLERKARNFSVGKATAKGKDQARAVSEGGVGNRRNHQ